MRELWSLSVRITCTPWLHKPTVVAALLFADNHQFYAAAHVINFTQFDLKKKTTINYFVSLQMHSRENIRCYCIHKQHFCRQMRIHGMGFWLNEPSWDKMPIVAFWTWKRLWKYYNWGKSCPEVGNTEKAFLSPTFSAMGRRGGEIFELNISL